MAGDPPEPMTVVEERPLSLRPDRAAVLTGWRAAPWRETRQRLALQMGEQVLGDRLHADLRQQHGLTYSTGCSYRPSKGVPQASLLSVAFYVAPERVEEALERTLQGVHALAEQGPGEAEMAAVRRQFSDLVTRVQRDPRYWCRVLSELRLRRLDPSLLARLPQEVLALDVGDVQQVLARWITDPGRVTVVCRPDAG